MSLYRASTYVFTSLGCPYRCSFCSIWPQYGGAYHQRDVESVIAELKTLEEYGIGRPSTYAPTIGTLDRRGYMFRQGKALVPSFTAFAVTGLLRDHFEDFVDIGFTAEMEKDLDEISNGERPWLDFIREFFRGDGRHHKGLEAMARDEGQNIDYPVVDIGTDPETDIAVLKIDAPKLPVDLDLASPYADMQPEHSDA